MVTNWKRLYVLGGLCCVAGIGSCFDRNEELPQSILPTAEAQELSPAVAKVAGDHTRAIELRFEGEGTQLTREDEAALGAFLRGQSGHVREYKILVWSTLSQNADGTRQLAAARGEALRNAIAAPDAPATVVNFAERENEGAAPAQAAVLAVME